MNSPSDAFSRLPEPGRSRPERSGPAREGLAVGVPLAKLIKRRIVDAPEIVMVGRTRSLAAEKYRRLKTLLTNDPMGSPRVIMVTSTGPEEGKSLTALNLALAFASDANDEVLLIDADLRRPSIADWVTPAPQLGFAELLQDKTESEHTILEVKDSNLRILPAGEPPPDPVVLLASEKARALMAGFRKRFDRIIIDTPPVIPFTDADALGSQADGVLLVVRAGRTRRSILTQALSSVTSTRVLGTVLNDATENLADHGRYAYYHRYYGHYSTDKNK